jgi:hypothetical protein
MALSKARPVGVSPERIEDMSLRPVERRALRPRAFDPRGECEEFKGGGWNFMGRLAGAAVVWSRVSPTRVSSSHELGLENSAIRSQERRSGLGLGLAKMYI